MVLRVAYIGVFRVEAASTATGQLAATTVWMEEQTVRDS